METVTLTLNCDDAPLQLALRSLAELAKRSPKVVKRFLRSRDLGAELVRVDSDTLAASGADELRIVLQPSDRLVNFLTTSGAGNV